MLEQLRYRVSPSLLRARLRQAWAYERGVILLGLLLLVLGEVIFGVLLWLVQSERIMPLDWSVYRWSYSHGVADQATRPWMVAVQQVISHAFSTLAVVIALGILTFFWLRKQLLILGAVVAPLLIGDLIRLVLIEVVRRPRPPEQLITTLFPHSSFPSGHAATTIFVIVPLAWGLWYIVRPHWRWLLLLDVVLILVASGWSRLYFGVHWLSDILAAYAFGGGLVAAVLGLATALRRTSEPSPNGAVPEWGTE